MGRAGAGKQLRGGRWPAWPAQGCCPQVPSFSQVCLPPVPGVCRVPGCGSSRCWGQALSGVGGDPQCPSRVLALLCLPQERAEAGLSDLQTPAGRAPRLGRGGGRLPPPPSSSLHRGGSVSSTDEGSEKQRLPPPRLPQSTQLLPLSPRACPPPTPAVCPPPASLACLPGAH